MNTVNVNMDVVNANCGIIRQVGMTPGLAGRFFTISTKHAMKDYEKIKESIDSNAQAPDLFINRAIPTFDIKDHVVLSQAVETDATGNVKVIFNPDTDDEAKATVVAGGIGFGEATSSAIKKAIGPNGKDVIFADGKKLLKETDDLIDGQIAWIDSLMNRLTKAKQSLETSKRENANKINSYYANLSNTTPKEVNISGSGDSVEVHIENAE